MTPNARERALAHYRTMHPTPERERLREAIEAIDHRESAAQHHEDAARDLARATEVHAAAEQRLADLEPAAAAGEAHVRELLED